MRPNLNALTAKPTVLASIPDNMTPATTSISYVWQDNMGGSEEFQARVNKSNHKTLGKEHRMGVIRGQHQIHGATRGYTSLGGGQARARCSPYQVGLCDQDQGSAGSSVGASEVKVDHSLSRAAGSNGG
eukprot:Gb_08626 [translate_table: standard]